MSHRLALAAALRLVNVSPLAATSTSVRFGERGKGRPKWGRRGFLLTAQRPRFVPGEFFKQRWRKKLSIALRGRRSHLVVLKRSIKRFQGCRGRDSSFRLQSRILQGQRSRRRCFETAGVEFIDENGGGYGVRLRRRFGKARK